MPAPNAPGGAREKETAGAKGPLAIALACPKCGAPFTADDAVVSVTCAHCGSLLVLSARGRDEVYVADGVVRGAEDIRTILIEYRVQAERAEIVARHADGEGNPPGELFIRMRLAAFEQRLRESVQIVDAYRLEVPYWHLTGRIVQATVGRHGDGPKLVRVHAWDVEHTVPGYDTAAADLRDRGLRLAASCVQPLLASDLESRGPFLPWVPATPQHYREIDKWRARDLEPGVEVITRQAGYVGARRLLVYRPYWLARVRVDGPLVWVLVDGSFASIAGHPDDTEAATLVRQAIEDPLRSTGESYRRVTVTASRCPDCGFESRVDRGAHVFLCPNCHLALAPSPDGLRIRPYAHARVGDVRLDGDHLPFWRFRFRLELAGAPPITTLEDYARVLFPQGAPAGFAPRGPHLWVPAVRLLGTENGDAAFQGLVQWVHSAEVAVEEGKLPLGGECVLWPVTLAEADAREAGAFVLLGLHDKASAARLNTMLVRRAVLEAALTLEEAQLVMVPLERRADGVLHPPASMVRLPPLLLRGGPELEALRRTVQAAARAMEDSAQQRPRAVFRRDAFDA